MHVSPQRWPQLHSDGWGGERRKDAYGCLPFELLEAADGLSSCIIRDAERQIEGTQAVADSIRYREAEVQRGIATMIHNHRGTEMQMQR